MACRTEGEGLMAQCHEGVEEIKRAFERVLKDPPTPKRTAEGPFSVLDFFERQPPDDRSALLEKKLYDLHLVIANMEIKIIDIQFSCDLLAGNLLDVCNEKHAITDKMHQHMQAYAKEIQRLRDKLDHIENAAKTP